MSSKNRGHEPGVIYAVLLGLMLVSVGSFFLKFGPWQPTIPLLLAAAQAVLVILFFMHVRSGPELIWLFAGGGFLWLAILLVLVLSDYASRSWLRG